MTPAELDAIEARAKAATPGPWCVDDWIVEPGDTPEQWHVFEAGEDDPPLFSSAFGGEADAVFAACARADVPSLVSEVRRLHDLCGDLLEAKFKAVRPRCEGTASWLLPDGEMRVLCANCGVYLNDRNEWGCQDELRKDWLPCAKNQPVTG